MQNSLKPFWRYYGGKWRAAPRYPTPKFNTIVEPFAGAAGYSLRYPDLEIVLIEKYPVIAEMWRYLISVTHDEIQRIPSVDHIDDLPSWVPQPARDLVGFWLSNAVTSPRKTLTSGRKKLAASGRKLEGWTQATRDRVASQAHRIRHWKIIEGDYSRAPDALATWFVDPPYNNKAGSNYIHASVNYADLATWCRSRRGQILVCENEGATWAPFQPFATLKAGVNGHGSREVIWELTG
jgi:site-specific DNA-adenine methylase